MAGGGSSYYQIVFTDSQSASKILQRPRQQYHAPTDEELFTIDDEDRPSVAPPPPKEVGISVQPIVKTRSLTARRTGAKEDHQNTLLNLDIGGKEDCDEVTVEGTHTYEMSTRDTQVLVDQAQMTNDWRSARRRRLYYIVGIVSLVVGILAILVIVLILTV